MRTIFKMLQGLALGLVLSLSCSDASALQQCPDNFVAFRGTDAALSCTCPEESTQRGGVWGMDVYTEDSGICQAAVHAGLIGAEGGDVTVMPAPGRKAYAGLTRNGVSSGNNGPSDGSFSFISPPAAPAQPATAAQSVQPAPPSPPSQPIAQPEPAAEVIRQCPDNFVAFRGTSTPLSCFCPADTMQAGAVWGMDVYTEDSWICQAAQHAGVLSSSGGNVTVVPQPGRQTYAGLDRNNVSSGNNGASEGSFAFAPAGTTAIYRPVKPITQPQPMVAMTQCPDNFVAFRGSNNPLSCYCPPESLEAGGVWGMDVYTEDSAICQAAVHDGVLTRTGGNLSVLPQPGRKAYAGVTRNGISSGNNGPAEGSFSFSPELLAAAPAELPAPAPVAPIQQDVAKSLMETGQVQLYIHFATDSDQLYDDSLPTLQELLAALRANPDLSLKLIGHTDNVGAPGYNLDLSTKRAKAVRYWLIQQGVLPTRILSEGRGLAEPLEDNGTEYGRAANRRVQAIRLP